MDQRRSLTIKVLGCSDSEQKPATNKEWMAGSCEFDTYLTEIGFKITNSLNKKVQHFLHIFGNLRIRILVLI